MLPLLGPLLPPPPGAAGRRPIVHAVKEEWQVAMHKVVTLHQKRIHHLGEQEKKRQEVPAIEPEGSVIWEFPKIGDPNRGS